MYHPDILTCPPLSAYVLRIPRGSKGPVIIKLYGKTKEGREVPVREETYKLKEFPKAKKNKQFVKLFKRSN